MCFYILCVCTSQKDDTHNLIFKFKFICYNYKWANTSVLDVVFLIMDAKETRKDFVKSRHHAGHPNLRIIEIILVFVRTAIIPSQQT